MPRLQLMPASLDPKEYELVDQDGIHVCNVHNSNFRETIIHSINSHAALVEALEACQARLGCGCGGEFGLCNRCSEVYDAIDKALIQAKGGA